MTHRPLPGLEITQSDAEGRPRSLRVIEPESFEVLPPSTQLPAQMPAPPVHVVQETSGDHLNRAWAFSVETGQLALITGVALVAVVNVVRGELALLLGLGIFASGFAAVWLAAYIMHVLTSAEGIALFNAARFWAHMKREQSHRHRLERDR